MKQHLLAALAIAASANPALARQDQPITDRDPDAMDVAKTPVTDLNMDKEEIPAKLIEAMRQPYDLRGLPTCRPLINEVETFDALLGPDIDLPQAERDRISAGRVAKTVVGSFIPFRGLIREVSGANKHENRVRAAIQAGLARRGFLKGIGQSRGCRYPARPATRKNVAAWMAEQKVAQQQQAAGRKSKPKKPKDARPYTSRPVVQETD